MVGVSCQKSDDSKVLRNISDSNFFSLFARAIAFESDAFLHKFLNGSPEKHIVHSRRWVFISITLRANGDRSQKLKQSLSI
jgi:hypothetical protein